MVYYLKVYVNLTDFKIEQHRDDGIVRFVNIDYAGYVRWLSLGNTPVVVPYVPPVDDDPVLLKAAKRDKIQLIREEFARRIEEDYDCMTIALQDAKTCVSLSKSNGLPSSFSNMMDSISVNDTWKNNKIAQVKACALVSCVNSITF